MALITHLLLIDHIRKTANTVIIPIIPHCDVVGTAVVSGGGVGVIVGVGVGGTDTVTSESPPIATVKGPEPFW